MKCMSCQRTLHFSTELVFHCVFLLLPKFIFLMECFRVQTKSPINIHMCQHTKIYVMFSVRSRFGMHFVHRALGGRRDGDKVEQQLNINIFTQPDTHHQHQNAWMLCNYGKWETIPLIVLLRSLHFLRWYGTVQSLWKKKENERKKCIQYLQTQFVIAMQRLRSYTARRMWRFVGFFWKNLQFSFTRNGLFCTCMSND